jgi:hypothetical protein
MVSWLWQMPKQYSPLHSLDPTANTQDAPRLATSCGPETEPFKCPPPCYQHLAPYEPGSCHACRPPSDDFSIAHRFGMAVQFAAHVVKQPADCCSRPFHGFSSGPHYHLTFQIQQHTLGPGLMTFSGEAENLAAKASANADANCTYCSTMLCTAPHSCDANCRSNAHPRHYCSFPRAM